LERLEKNNFFISISKYLGK